jgi:hypothetical protein
MVDPYRVVFHDFLTEKEIEWIVDYSKPKLSRTRLITKSNYEGEKVLNLSLKFVVRQRDRRTERQRDRQTRGERNKETERQRELETERQSDRKTERQRDRKTERKRDREKERQRDRETERQRDRERESSPNCIIEEKSFYHFVFEQHSSVFFYKTI